VSELGQPRRVAELDPRHNSWLGLILTQHPGALPLEAPIEVHSVPRRQSCRYEVLRPVRGTPAICVPVMRRRQLP
jgi:hypothetical protein